MIPRYELPEMAALFTDVSRFGRWLEIELLATEAWSALGVVPPADDAVCRFRAPAIDDAFLAVVDERERVTDHDVAAFVDVVQERIGGEAGKWIHHGLTSTDLVDTALSWVLRDAADLLIEASTALIAVLKETAIRYRSTVMVGRTHGVHAEPMTFGLKLALWYAELQRDLDRLLRAREVVSVGKISGAVGTFAHLDPSIEARVCERLGLEPAPVSSQIIQRDRHAELLSALAITAASLEKFALEIRGLQKTEIGEVEEPFGKGQKGSSAMPHKRNPIASEQIVGLARLIRANAMAAFENIALWHERDISHSSVERVILPDSFIALDHMLRRFARIVRGMVVYPERMLENLARSRGVVFSGTVLLELARRGVSREQAYEWVQRNAMRSFDQKRDFRQLLLADPEVMRILGPADIEKAFSLDDQLRNVDAVFARVFSGAEVAVGVR